MKTLIFELIPPPWRDWYNDNKRQHLQLNIEWGDFYLPLVVSIERDLMEALCDGQLYTNRSSKCMFNQSRECQTQTQIQYKTTITSDHRRCKQFYSVISTPRCLFRWANSRPAAGSQQDVLITLWNCRNMIAYSGHVLRGLRKALFCSILAYPLRHLKELI